MERHAFQFGTSVHGIVRRPCPDVDDGTVEILDLPYPTISDALWDGLTIDDLGTATTRSRILMEKVALSVPVPRPSKIWAVGFAYTDHRVEVGHSTAEEDPYIFMKAPSSLIASYEQIVLPPVAPGKVDYEGELGVVIGRRASHAGVDEAREAIAGYTICNDVSARDVQKGELPGRVANVSVGKSFDTFTPVAPWITTLGSLNNPDDLRLRTWVNGDLRQDARTSQLIYPVPELISYLSHHTTLEAGDLILTGTPSGVGHKVGRFLGPGSEVRVEIEGLGYLINSVVAARPAR